MASKFTREQLIKKAQEQIVFCRHTKITGEGLVHVNQCAALFEIALAAMDSEPVADDGIYRPGDAVGVFNVGCETCPDHLVAWTVKGQNLPAGNYWLYISQQPVPVVPEEKPMPNPLSMYAVDAVAAIAEVKGKAAVTQEKECQHEWTAYGMPGDKGFGAIFSLCRCRLCGEKSRRDGFK